MAIKFTQTVIDHFSNPRNVGKIENPDGMGEVGDPSCGDFMRFTIKITDNHIADIKFMMQGCVAAIAVASMTSEMAQGKSIEEALRISNESVAEKLGGLPAHKVHCSNLGADALHAAIRSYLNARKSGTVTPEKAVIDQGNE
ncbi:iron-sulfur cluster assembly scaffold protein [Planctomycetota bacterium]